MRFLQRSFTSSSFILTDVRARVMMDMKAAMKSSDKLTSSVLKSLLSDFTYAEKSTQNSGRAISLISIVEKAIKMRAESIAQYGAGGRQDLVDQESQEMKILEKYLPEKIDLAEVKEKIESVIKESGANSVKDLSKIMKSLDQTIPDGSIKKGDLVNIIKSLLSNK